MANRLTNKTVALPSRFFHCRRLSLGDHLSVSLEVSTQLGPGAYSSRSQPDGMPRVRRSAGGVPGHQRRPIRKLINHRIDLGLDGSPSETEAHGAHADPFRHAHGGEHGGELDPARMAR